MTSPEKLLDAIERAPSLSVASPLIFDDLAPPDARDALPLSRVRAARSWLFALGYLPVDIDSGAYDPELRAAVGKFQREAGLTVDGWIGQRETWPRLREIVAFEAAPDPYFWSTGPATGREALRRAALTRLAVYGFGAPEQPDGADALDPCFDRFLAVLRRLGVPVPDPAATPADRLLFVLSHDAHQRALAVCLSRDPALALFQLRPRDAETLETFGFLLNVAKVELWMVQSEGIDLPRRHDGDLTVDGGYFVPAALDRGLDRYFDAVGSSAPALTALKRVYRRARRNNDIVGALAAFFQAAEMNTAPAGGAQAVRADDLHAFYDDPRHGTARSKASSDTLAGKEGLRSRLWDGLRRLWTWIRETVRKAVAAGRRALDVARRIARAAFRVASDAFFFVAQIVEAFVHHCGVAVSRTNSDSLGRIVVRREFGRDTDILVSSVAPPALPALYAGQLVLSAKIFRCACRIVGKLIGFAVSLAAGIGAAPLALRALVWAAVNAREVVADFRRIVALGLKHRLGAQALAAL